MARVPEIDPEQLSPEQRRVYDDIAGVRHGTVRGPFAIWLRNAEVAAAMNQAGNSVRLHGKLDKRLFELMVLMVARHWTAQYEWFVHEDAARNAGLSPDTVQAIRAGRRPELAAEDERLVYELVTELQDTRTVSQATYDRAAAMLGLDLLIELITAAGFYTMVAMVLNAFDAPVPGGKLPLG
jgi:4-carboxymuconolactone decarboxylase